MQNRTRIISLMRCWEKVNCNCDYCVLLCTFKYSLFLSVGLLRPHVSGMTPCWPFNAHCGELSCVFMFSSERQSARMSKIKNGGLDQYGKV